MILGIYHPAEGAGHDSAVALVDSEGKILAAQSEERFSRIKMDGGYPFRAFEALKKRVSFKPSDLQAVAIPYWGQTQKWNEGRRVFQEMLSNASFRRVWIKGRWKQDPFQQEMGKLGAYQYLDEYLAQIRNVHQQDKRPSLKGWRDFLNYAGVSQRPLVRVDHHMAHVASAYFSSGWPEALIVTADGAGALKSGLVAIGRDGKISVIARTFLPNSPGRFWEVITTLCGFNHHKHGGKVTGLAASGNPKAKCYEVMKRVLWSKGMTVQSNLEPLRMAAELQGYSREDLAATAQRRLEEVMLAVVQEAVRQTGTRKVALAGGVFSNVLLNQKIYELPGVEDVFIFPAMGDEGLAVGAAFWALTRKKKFMPYRLKDVYLGPEYSEFEIEEALKKYGLSYKRFKDSEMISKIVSLLMANKVIAYFEGRMEYGPRALGHRTILYGTGDPSVNKWLNDRLHRSEFMPFAPVTLTEEAEHCYERIKPNHYPAQFMTMTYQCTSFMKKSSPAVVHLDETARPQLVSLEINGRYYKILKEYFQKTGIPALVNTSFNMHEEPIVCSPEDAVRGFLDGGLDVLVMGPFCVEARPAGIHGKIIAGEKYEAG